MLHRPVQSKPGSWLWCVVLGCVLGCGGASGSSTAANPDTADSQSGAGSSSAAGKRVAAGTPFPELSFPLLDGGEWTSSSHRGQVLVLDIWATYCEPCLKAFPKLERWRQSYPGLAVIGLSVDEEDDVVREFLARAGVGFPIARDRDLSVRESELEIATIPALFVVDREGIVRIRRDLMDVDDYDKVESEIAQLLE